MLHLVNQTKLLFWKKMYTNSNVVLYTLSRYAGVPSRLWQLLVNTVYTRCGRQLEMSSLLCGSFFLQKLLVFRCAHLILSYAVLYFGVCVLCVLCVATFWCNK